MKYKFELFSPNFGLKTSPRESKQQYFEKAISETNSLLQSSSIDFDLSISFLIDDIQLWVLFTQFGDNDVTKEMNIPEF